MKILTSTLFAILIVCLAGPAQCQELTDTIQEQMKIPVGEQTRHNIQSGDFATFFMPEYQAYLPQQEILTNLKNHIYSYSIVIVLGTWCHDSQVQVPRFFKILDNLDYNTDELRIICVDREKKAGDIDISLLEIERVPTFIFYDEKNEIGRIIETPETTLEEDTYNILSR